jgi:hypothetical protein
MAELSFFWDAELVDGIYDRLYNSDDFATMFSCFFQDGIVLNAPDSLKPSIVEDTIGVKISAGDAFVWGRLFRLTADTTYPLELGGMQERIDLIVIRIDKGKRTAFIKTLKGAEGEGEPSYANTTLIKDIPLCRIRIPAGAVKIAESDFQDLRGTDVCPYSDIKLDLTTPLERFEEWFDGVKDQISEDESSKLKVLIAEVRTLAEQAQQSADDAAKVATDYIKEEDSNLIIGNLSSESGYKIALGNSLSLADGSTDLIKIQNVAGSNKDDNGMTVNLNKVLVYTNDAAFQGRKKGTDGVNYECNLGIQKAGEVFVSNWNKDDNTLVNQLVLGSSETYTPNNLRTGKKLSAAGDLAVSGDSSLSGSLSVGGKLTLPYSGMTFASAAASNALINIDGTLDTSNKAYTPIIKGTMDTGEVWVLGSGGNNNVGFKSYDADYSGSSYSRQLSWNISNGKLYNSGPIYSGQELSGSSLIVNGTDVTDFFTDSGWIRFTPTGVGYTSSQRCEYRKVGKMVTLSINFINTATSWTCIGTLPSGYIPTEQIFGSLCYMSTGNISGLLRIDTNGNMNVYGSAAGNYYAGSITFPTA